MRNLLIVLLWSLGVTGAAAQKSGKNFDLIGIPMVVEKKSAAPVFRATIKGKPVRVEKIDAPETVPLRIVVIDLRETSGNGRIAGKLPPELQALNLQKLRAQAGLIRIGQPPTGEQRLPAGWKLYTSLDFETAFRQAGSLFAAGRESERQALLVIKDLSPQSKLFDAALLKAADETAAGRLLRVLPDGSAGEAGQSGKTTLKTQIKKWLDSLSSFYVIRLAADMVPAIGGRIDAEALIGNKIVGRGSRQINPSPPPPFDEVETAFADFPRLLNFERMEKYPGLPEAELEYFKAHYAPPIEGVVIDSDPFGNGRLRKLSDRVFLLHAVQKQCAVVLLESRLPTVFTWKLTFVSLTSKDLEILSDEEITALVAHEVGHLYVADDLAKARVSGDERLARINELKCDLIALETLRRLGISEANLPSAIEKLIAARSAMNIKSLDAGSPVLEDRRRIARKYMENLKK